MFFGWLVKKTWDLFQPPLNSLLSLWRLNCFSGLHHFRFALHTRKKSSGMLRRLLSRRFLVFVTFVIGLTSLIYLLLSPSLYNRPGSEVKSRLTTNTKDDLVNGNSFLSVVKEGVSFVASVWVSTCLHDVLMKTIFIYLLVTLYFFCFRNWRSKHNKNHLWRFKVFKRVVW